jgi:SAM-dependent methyltransferase
MKGTPMAKQGEIEYLRNLGDVGVSHLVRKPFSDHECAKNLLQIGAVLTLLPPPPARLLDVGCGGGWTSLFFARRGYEVVGVDIAPDLIGEAHRLRDGEGLTNLRFVVADYEMMDFSEEFDCAVFYDALHHAVDENAAVRKVYQALRPGGICIVSEPGVGHADKHHTREAVRKYNVTEKDMPPPRVIAAGKRAGFRRCRVYPDAYRVAHLAYEPGAGRLGPLAVRWPWFQRVRSALMILVLNLFRTRRGGLVTMIK